MQLLAKFEYILSMGLRATLNFCNFKVALNLMYRILFLNFANSCISYGGPKGSITNQFTKTQINFPKHKSLYQNTKQFPKTQINCPKHKSVYQNTKQFLKTEINFSKHKPISSKHKSKDWALALLLSESLERTHSQDFPRPTWQLQICCR